MAGLSCQNTSQEWGHVRGILSAYEKTPRKQDKSLGEFFFFRDTGLFSESVFMLLPGVVVDRSEFTLDCSLLLAAVIQLNSILYVPLWKDIFAACGLSLWLYTT